MMVSNADVCAMNCCNGTKSWNDTFAKLFAKSMYARSDNWTYTPEYRVDINLDMGIEAPEVGGSSQHKSWKLLSCRLSYRFLVPSSAFLELLAAVSDALSTVLETFSSCLRCAVVVGSGIAVVCDVCGVSAVVLGAGGAPVGSNDFQSSSDSSLSWMFSRDVVGHDQAWASIRRIVCGGVIFRSSIDIVLWILL